MISSIIFVKTKIAATKKGITSRSRYLNTKYTNASSTAQNAVAVFRNLAAMKNVKSKALEWSLILAGVVLGVIFNNRRLLGWLPIIANLEYSVAVFKLKDNETALKTAFIVNMVMYAVFSLVILNYVGTASCAVIAVTTAVSLIKGKREPGNGEDK